MRVIQNPCARLALLLPVILCQCEKAAEPVVYDEIVVVARFSEKFLPKVLWLNDEPMGYFPSDSMFTWSDCFPLVPGKNVLRFVNAAEGGEKSEFDRFQVNHSVGGTGRPVSLEFQLPEVRATFDAVQPCPLPEGIRPGKASDETDAKLKRWVLKFMDSYEKSDSKVAMEMLGNPDLPAEVVAPMPQPGSKLEARVRTPGDLRSVHGRSITMVHADWQPEGEKDNSLIYWKDGDVHWRVRSLFFLMDESGHSYMMGRKGMLCLIRLE